MKTICLSRRKLLVVGIIMLIAGGILMLPLGRADQVVTTTAATGEPIFQGNTDSKAVAITVNVDWGEEYIPAMLKHFAEANASVTFFVTGRWAEKNPDLLKQMSAAGHSIQNHGYRHIHFNRLNAAQVASEIKQAEDIIAGITGQTSTYFASPYGEYNSQLVKAVNDINYQYIMWSVDTIDWQRPDPATITNRVMKKIHNDAIILMHPTEPTVKALPDMLQKLSAQNYQMVTIEKITGGKANAAQP